MTNNVGKSETAVGDAQLEWHALTLEATPERSRSIWQREELALYRELQRARSALAQVGGKCEAAWLIERRRQHNPVDWWTGQKWTTDANYATKYPSEAEAGLASLLVPRHSGSIIHEIVVCEHMFIGTGQQPRPADAEGPKCATCEGSGRLPPERIRHYNDPTVPCPDCRSATPPAQSDEVREALLDGAYLIEKQAEGMREPFLAERRKAASVLRRLADPKNS
jgi:hypothetical protein